MSFFLKGDILWGGGAGWDGNQEVHLKTPSVSGGDPERGGGCNGSVRVLGYDLVPQEDEGREGRGPRIKSS